MAREFADLGLSPRDATTWGLIPSLVEAYIEVGVDADAAAEWVRQSVMPHDVPPRMAQHGMAQHARARARLRDPWEVAQGDGDLDDYAAAKWNEELGSSSQRDRKFPGGQAPSADSGNVILLDARRAIDDLPF